VIIVDNMLKIWTFSRIAYSEYEQDGVLLFAKADLSTHKAGISFAKKV